MGSIADFNTRYCTYDRYNDPMPSRSELKRTVTALRDQIHQKILDIWNTGSDRKITNTCIRYNVRSLAWAFFVNGTADGIDYEETTFKAYQRGDLNNVTNCSLKKIADVIHSSVYNGQFTTIRRYARTLDIVAIDVLKTENWPKGSGCITYGVPKKFFYLAADFLDTVYIDLLTDEELKVIHDIIQSKHYNDKYLLTSLSAKLWKGKFPKFLKK